MNKKERLVYIDQMKGIAILLVIMGHLIGPNAGYNAVFSFIYSFHMPIFFIISGYLGYKTTKIDSFKTYGIFLKKKFIVLVIPFLFWNLIAEKYFLRTVWHIPALNDLTDAVLLWNRLWFLKMLFIIFVFYGITHWISKMFTKPKVCFCADVILFLAVAACIGASILTVDKDYFTSLLLFTSFFYLGAFISKYQWMEKLTMNHYVFSGSVILFLTWICHWDLEGGNIDKLYKCIISPVAYIIILNICRRITWNPKVSNQFEMFGKYSLAIYIVHFYLIEFTNHATVIEMNPVILFILSAVVAVMVGYLCIGFAKLMECSPVLDFLMFGKRNNTSLKKSALAASG